MTLQKSHNDKSLLFPIWLSVFYLAVTLIIYELCPYDWPTQNPVLFYSLNILYILALLFGYLLGQRHCFRLRVFLWTEKTTDILVKIVSVAIIINFFMYLIYVFRDYGFRTFDIVGLCKEMAVGLKNPGIGYLNHLKRLEVLDGPIVMGGYVYTVFNLLWGFVKVPVSILALMYFKRLKLYGKIFTVLYLLLVIVYYISIGTNIQFLHVLLLLVLPVVMETFDKWYSKELNAKAIIKLVAFVLVAVVLLCAYFGWMMESRSDASGYEIDEYPISGIVPDNSQNTPSQEMPVWLRKINNLWISFSSYLSQGYYGMSQALGLEWTPMFGLGNSMFVVDMISDHIYDIDQFTYQVKLEPFGWDSDVRWHSMYTWIANDVSFYGVILVMFVIGILFGMMFKDAVVNKNPLARCSIFFYILMLIFIPCNNQVAQSNETFCPFILLILLWLLFGRQPAPAAQTEG